MIGTLRRNPAWLPDSRWTRQRAKCVSEGGAQRRAETACKSRGSRASKTTRYRAHDSILTYRPEQFAGGIGQHVSRAPAQPSLELAAIRDMMTKGDSDPRILVREHDLHLNRQQPIIQDSRIA